MFKVRVPASTANLGPGFDCMGVALGMYSEAVFEQVDSGFHIDVVNEGGEYIPRNENNLIFRAIDYLYKKAGKPLGGVKVRVDSGIPVTRGLGSSSAAIVMGLKAGNEMLGGIFSNDDLLYAAYEIEGHPDNVTPALVGGFTVSFCDSKRIIYTKSEISPDICFAAMMPDFYFSTRKSRALIPEYVRLKDTSYNIARASLLSAALTKGDTSLLSVCFRDRIHQKYRFPHIRSGEYIIRAAKRFGACGGYISGAGPTIMSVVCGNSEEFESQMTSLIKTNLPNWRLVMLSADNTGAVIEKNI